MHRYKREWLMVAGMAAIMNAQTAQLQFEVASVRPSAPLQAGASGSMRNTGGPGTGDPERITYSRVPMRSLISQVYRVGFDQIAGPEWVVTTAGAEATRYDISAKIPPGTTQAQFTEMLRNLLAERFQLTLHHATKEFSGYALVVAKGGSKLKQSAGPLTEAEKTEPSASGGLSMELEKDGFPRLFPGRNMGGHYDERDEGDEVRIRFRDYSLSDLAQQLSFPLLTHVVDKTGMMGKFDFTLKFELPREAFMVGFGAISPLAPGEPWIGSTNQPAPAQVDAVPIISAAMEKQLGLKLEPAKIPMDVLVIDHIEKTPAQN